MRIEECHHGLSERLQARSPEIEQAVLARIQTVSDPQLKSDPEYHDGLRSAVSAALEYAISAIRQSEYSSAPIPDALLSQVRLAARHGVKLETVLRRYIAGHTTLGDYMIEESERYGPTKGKALKRLLRIEAGALDRLVAAVSDEYARELMARPGSNAQRRLRRVEQLLSGEELDAPELAYDLDCHHIGLVGYGNRSRPVLAELAQELGSRLLIVQRDERTIWAWLGGRRRIDSADIQHRLVARCQAQLSLALGEPGQGLAGWRLTHRQAQAAASIARTAQEPTRYVDVAIWLRSDRMRS